ncbi:cation:dicarboxylase symporter family transporter [bacterium]|nr:cation:dicarboxylase symporter family transporter [bacterium]
MFKINFRSNSVLLFFTALGILTPFLGMEMLLTIANTVTTLFIKTLKTISLPILFLSLASTLTSMDSVKETKHIGQKVLYYTLTTTAMAAIIALFVFVFITPYLSPPAEAQALVAEGKSYLQVVLDLFPQNFVEPFASGNAFGVVLLAFGLGLSAQFVPLEQKHTLHKGFEALFSLFLRLAESITFVLPIAAWAFMTELVVSISTTSTTSLTMLLLFLGCIVSVNLFQAFVALPVLLWKNGISPFQLFSDVQKSLSIAFFTKSSSAALPFSIDLMERKSGVSSKISHFALPLCSTINMNGCAQFILLSILFSATYCGLPITFTGSLFWLVIAIFAAIGNAGVPMGCYFLASLLLTSVGVPLVFMGLILPFYPILDMIETAVNVWSDICITKITDKRLKEEELVLQKV